MKALQAASLAEELQEYIQDNVTGLSLTYTMGENFTLGDILNVQDLDDLTGSAVDLSMYEESGSLIPSGRQTHQERSFRFVHRGTYGQQAVSRAWELLQWLWNKKTFQTPTFRVWVVRAPVTPTVIFRDRSGIHLSDFVITTRVFNLV